MPTYDYVCDACGHKFELFQSMSERLVKKCPKCGKPRARRLIGPGAGLIFKGSGFYITDYRSQDYKNQAKADVEPPKPKADAKADAKPDAPKTETPKSEKPAPSSNKGDKPKKKGKKGD
ncbi:MAG: zinc ribbon domain-containing protein [Planctomycetes bacterium]|nr:zinc ribbon domain-containing protein [Planctomycetota bacterium]MBI3846761.1 zinc ribbon domain-containing protein [Planctomycetota bacterium]